MSAGAHARGGHNAHLVRQAAKHKRAGLKYLHRHKLDRAIDELEIAYGLSQQPIVAYYLAEAYSEHKSVPQALYYYKAYRDADPKGAARHHVDDKMAALTAQKSGGTPGAATGRAGSPGDDQHGKAAAGHDAAAGGEPGGQGDAGEKAHPIDDNKVTAGHSSPTEVAARPHEMPRADHPAPRVNPVVVATTSRRSTSSSAGRGARVTGLVLGGLSVALLGGGAYYGWVAHKRESEISKLFASGGTWDPSYDKRYQQGRDARRNALILVGAGAATATLGLVFYYLGHRAGAASHLEVSPTSGGASVSMRWTD